MSSSAVHDLAEQIARFLDESDLRYTRAEDDSFELQWQDGSSVRVRPTAWEGWGPDKSLAVWISSVVGTGVRIDAALHEHVATLNGIVGFGRYAVRMEPPAVIVSFNLLGDFLNRAELDFAIRVLVFETRTRGAWIRDRWGGDY